MEEKKNDIEEDMSKTFVTEVGQKSAIAQNEVEELETSRESSNFPEVKIEPPKEKLTMDSATNTNDLGNMNSSTIDDNQSIPGYEKESMIYEDVKKKKGHPLLIAFFMILCLALGAGGSYYYFELYNQKDETKVDQTNTQDKNTTTEEELNPNGVFVTDLIGRYDAYVITNCEIYTNLYSKEKINAEEIPSEEIKFLAAKEALNMNRSKDPTIFTSEQFHEAATKLFGSTTIVNDGDINLYTNTPGAIFTYNATSNTYQYQTPQVGGTTVYSMERKNIKAIKNDDSLEITVAIAILDNSTKKVYKGYNATAGSDILGTDEITDLTADTFNIDQDYTKLNQYKYIYNYDSENDNYYLKSIELVK